MAVAQFVPKDPDQKKSVLMVLRGHPELQRFIEQVGDKARIVFPDPQIVLDSVQYDDWDPPVRMILNVSQPWEKFNSAFDTFMDWLSTTPDYDRDLIVVLPMWNGPLDSAK